MHEVNLGNVDTTKPALLHFMTAGVRFTRNFVTWTPFTPFPYVHIVSYEEAREQQYIDFVGPIIRNRADSLDSFTQQTLRLRPGLLQKGNLNLLAIHSRNETGDTKDIRDKFGIANIWLLYHLEDGPSPPFQVGTVTQTARRMSPEEVPNL